MHLVRPYIPKGNHPIETGNYLLATNEINKLLIKVLRWINNRATGTMVYGRPRLGKSKAIRYLGYELPSRLGKGLPVFHIRCNKYKYPNENIFFENLLKYVGHELFMKGKANIKRERLLKFFIERGESSGQNRIILFLDDAQRLSEIEYDWLMDIYNELERYNITLTVILVGQKELVTQKNSFKVLKKEQIIGRFMTHEYQFSGIKSIADISTCLVGYDKESEHPAGSGWSYTRYFFPEQFERGQRLENCTEDLFNAFAELRQEANLPKTSEIPMQYFTGTVENALKNYGINGEDVEWMTKLLWKTAIEESGYIDAERVRSEFKEDI